jgi:hypothetical protein
LLDKDEPPAFAPEELVEVSNRTIDSAIDFQASMEGTGVRTAASSDGSSTPPTRKECDMENFDDSFGLCPFCHKMSGFDHIEPTAKSTSMTRAPLLSALRRPLT